MLICLVSSPGVRKGEIFSDWVVGKENQKSEWYVKGEVDAEEWRKENARNTTRSSEGQCEVATSRVKACGSPMPPLGTGELSEQGVPVQL